MEEIKLRVWHKEDKKYYTAKNWQVLRWLDEGQPVVIEQFTGVLDKNANDICEGDIVSDHIGIGLVKYSKKYGAFRVSYGDGFAKWFYDYILNGEKDSIEIIGNINENPELIGG